MNPLNEKITLGKLLYLLLETRRFNNAKCTIWDDSKPIYVDKVGFIKDYITRGKLAEISNLQYLSTNLGVSSELENIEYSLYLSSCTFLASFTLFLISSEVSIFS